MDPRQPSLACPRRAFTLLELLVVVVLIAVLISIVSPHLRAAIRASRQAGCLSNLHQVAVAVDEARGKNMSLPTTWPQVDEGTGVWSLRCRENTDHTPYYLDPLSNHYAGANDIDTCTWDYWGGPKPEAGWATNRIAVAQDGAGPDGALKAWHGWWNRGFLDGSARRPGPTDEKP